MWKESSESRAPTVLWFYNDIYYTIVKRKKATFMQQFGQPYKFLGSKNKAFGLGKGF